MSVTVTARQRIPTAMHRYAEEKLERLSRHTTLHDVTMVIDHDENRNPACQAEVIVHIHHTRLAAKVEAGTVQEAIDLVVDKADRQVLRRKDRVTDHKGHVGASGMTARSIAVTAIAAETGIVSERRLRLEPRSRVDALAEAETRADTHFFYLDEERGDVSLLVRRPGGGYDLIIADAR